MNNSDAKRLLALWLSMEALSMPQAPSGIKRILKNNQLKNVDLNIGIFNASPLITQLVDRCSRYNKFADVTDEHEPPPSGRLTWICNLSLDATGMPLPATFSLSLFLWAVGHILNDPTGILINLDGRGSSQRRPQDLFAGYSNYQETQRIYLQTHVDDTDPTISRPTSTWLNEFVERTVSGIGLSFKELVPDGELYIRSQSRSLTGLDKTSRQQDILDSKLLSDLTQLFNSDFDKLPRTLRSYLCQSPSSPRINVRSEDGLRNAIRAVKYTNFPVGCWPSEHALAFSQQLAINVMADELKDEGLFTVNGPPGTGKTTLLRDVVAMIVTNRGKELLKLDNPLQGYDQTGTLIPALTGFSIVVASGNNGAVENVSLELPRADAVSKTTPHSYFAEIGSNLLGDGTPAWGLLASKLGNKNNRTAFVNTLNANPYQSIERPSYPLGLSYGEGLKLHLDLIASGHRQPLMSWTRAKDAFQKALNREQQCRLDIESLVDYGTAIDQLSRHVEKMALIVKQQASKLSVMESQLNQLRQQSEENKPACTHYHDLLEKHQLAKPGILSLIATLGRSYREHYSKTQELMVKRSQYDEMQFQLDQQIRLLTREFDDLQVAHTDNIRQLEEDSQRYSQERISPKMQQCRYLAETVPKPTDTDEVRELKSPWNFPAWTTARKTVFTAALDLHRAFIEATPETTSISLNKISSWLNGESYNANTAFDHLCLITPVISTTFASVQSMFRKMGPGSIEWLLIDEAGQSTPQYAAGAIYRAKRVVVVGDPLQLEPIVTVPKQVEAVLGSRYQIDRSLWPSRQSVQTRSDASMRWGTYISHAGSDDKAWIGVPLRAHRRCDNPMFTISNGIAYDGMMVHGTKASPSPLPKSAWIDNASSDVKMKHWVPAEGEVFKQLVSTLIKCYGQDPKQIFVITPFVAVSNSLKQLGMTHGLDAAKIGTVHTAQGKEADVVIFVLGGDPTQTGDKTWASQKVNLPNVAVSRGKQRLYVIGHHEQWSTYRYFSVIARSLPKVASVDDLVASMSTYLP